MSKAIKIFVEFVIAFLAVILAAFALLVWRVASQPITSTTLTPYVEAAISGLVPDTKAEISKTIIVWDNIDRTIAVQGEDVKLRDGKNNIIAEFPSVKLKLSVLGMLIGRFVPSELDINRPQLRFIRNIDGLITFGKTKVEQTEKETTGQISIIDFTRKFSEDITRVGLLKKIDITNLALYIHDEETSLDRVIDIPEISLNNANGNLEGLAKIEAIQKDHSVLLQAHYLFDRKKAEHLVTLLFSEINLSLFAGTHPKLSPLAIFDLPFSGEVTLTADKELNLVSTTAQIEGKEGKLIATDFWDNPREIKKLSLTANYDRAQHKLSVPMIEMDMNGPKLTLKLDANQPEDGSASPSGKPYDMEFALEIGLSDLPMDQYGAVWPKPIIANAREWVANNMSKGIFKNGEVKLRGKLAWDDIENLVLDYGSGKISALDGNVRYMEGMPYVEGVSAQATFDLDHMDVNVSGGGIGALKLKPSTINLTDFQTNIQNIILPVRFSGPVKDVIKLLDSPALGYAKEVGLRADDGEGTVDGGLDLRFPLLNSLAMKDVDIKADAKLKEFSAAKLISGIEISQGNLALDLNKEGFTLNGQAALNKVPLTVDWRAVFAPEQNKPRYQANLTGTISPEQWALLGLDIKGKIEGNTSAAIQYTQSDKTLSTLSGEFDFRQTSIQIDELGWKKPVGESAILKLDAEIPVDKNINIKSIDLQGANVKAKGDAVLSPNMRLLSVDMEQLEVGRINAKLKFSQSLDDNGSMKFEIDGESFDISGIKGDKNPQLINPRPKEYKIKLAKLYTSEEGFIDNITGSARRDLKGWSELELHGLANGNHQLDISLATKKTRRVFSITCNDFGKALKGLGLTNTVKSGEWEVKGESSAEDPRVIEGKIKIGSFYVEGLPALVRLLNAASPFGFADLISGEASFDHLYGNFRWHGDEIEFSKVRASGSVFGINVDGHIDLNTSEANLHGTLVPFSFFNSIINVVPLLGNVITGGDGQGIIAASYTVKGKLSDPDISVNPVSLLTPGFLRNLFFSGEGHEKEAQEDVPIVKVPN